MPPSKRKVAGYANGMKARGRPEFHEQRQLELAAKTLMGKNSIAKGQSKARKNIGTGKDRAVGGARKPCLWLWLQDSDGVETHAAAHDNRAAVNMVWSWGRKHDLCLVSSEWDVRHPKYGWQNAYNVMITREDFVGDNDELRGFWSKYFGKCMRSMTSKDCFEAEGEGAKIACYTNAERRPFWASPSAAAAGGSSTSGA